MYTRISYPWRDEEGLAVAPAVFRGSAAYDAARRPVVTIGNFDGVHLGHRELVALCVERARALGVPAVVYTFDPAPRDVIRPGNGIPRIQSLEDKIARLGEFGIDEVVVEPFDLDFAALPPRVFADRVLRERLGASELVVGWDFRFGARRAGTVADLEAWHALPVHQVPPLKDDGGEVVSSSRIRQLVRRGEVAAASRLLGRPHEVVGSVVRGDARGRRLGFPTANLDVHTALVPANGVYAVRADGHAGVANIGFRPTMAAGFAVEVHLLDFSGDLYGKRLRVQFVDRLRDEMRFDGLDALVHQIGLDVEKVRNIL